MRLEVLETRDCPAAFNYGRNPISQFYHFDTADGLPIEGYTGPVQQALCDVDGDGFADEVYVAGPGGSAHAVAYSGRPGTHGLVVLSELILGDETFRGGVSHVEGFDTNGDTIPDTLVAAPGTGGGGVLAVVDATGSHGLQLGPEDYRGGVLALDGFRVPGQGAQEVEVILAGPRNVLAAADVVTGRIDAGFYLPAGYDTLAPATQGVPVDGVPTVGVQQGEDASTTILFDLQGGRHHVAPLGGPGVL